MHFIAKYDTKILPLKKALGKKRLEIVLCSKSALENPQNTASLRLKSRLAEKNCPLGFDLADFRQKVPWERSRVAFSEVIFGENIGRTDKLSSSC